MLIQICYRVRYQNTQFVLFLLELENIERENEARECGRNKEASGFKSEAWGGVVKIETNCRR